MIFVPGRRKCVCMSMMYWPESFFARSSARSPTLRHPAAHFLDAGLELSLFVRLQTGHELVARNRLHGDRRWKQRFGGGEFFQLVGGKHAHGSSLERRRRGARSAGILSHRWRAGQTSEITGTHPRSPAADPAYIETPIPSPCVSA